MTHDTSPCYFLYALCKSVTYNKFLVEVPEWVQAKGHFSLSSTSVAACKNNCTYQKVHCKGHKSH